VRLITQPLSDEDDLSSRLLRNSVLASLAPADLDALAGEMKIVALTRGQTTNQFDQELRHVDFPLDAMVSIMATFASGSTCEVAFVGREGFVEADAALMYDEVARTTVCQIPGTVARIRADAFAEKLRSLPSLDRAVRRSLRMRLYITEQIAACNLRHTVTERLARWLLTTSDQMQRPQVALTQETFAIMLGVRRAGVSEAATALQRLGAVRIERAAINVVDRATLRASACECYDAIHGVMQRAAVPMGSDAG
jgi:CRP-like cAMP-binding protein